MKQLLLILLLVSPFVVYAKTSCDSACWAARLYQLQATRMMNEQAMRQKEYLEAKRREAIRNEAEKTQRKKKLLEQTQKHCNSVDLNEVDFEKRTLCNAVQGYFLYGIEVSDAMLGLS